MDYGVPLSKTFEHLDDAATAIEIFCSTTADGSEKHTYALAGTVESAANRH